MANFCGKCGAPVDSKSGLCPNCDREKMQPAQEAQSSIPLQPKAMTDESASVTPKKTKRQKPAVLTVLLTVFLSVCLFLTMFPAIAIFNVRRAMDEDLVEKGIEKALFTSSDLSYGEASAFVEETYGITLEEQELKRFIQRSEVKEFVADQIAEFCDDLMEGEGRVRITKREFIEALQEDARMLEREFNVELDDDKIMEAADSVFEEDVLSVDVRDVMEILEESQGFDEFENSRQLYRLFTAVFSYHVLLVFAVLSGILILLMCFNSLSQGTLGIGIVFLTWGAIFGIFSALLLWAASIMEAVFSNAFVVVFFGNFMTTGMLTGAVLLALGILILVVRKIVKKHQAKKQKAVA